MNPELKSHLSAKNTWIRLLYMILFVIAFNVAEVVAGAVVAVQFLFKLLTGEVNEQLRGFGHTLAAYFNQTVAFLTYDTEDMPFPFAPWPDGGGEATRPAAQAPEPPPAQPAPEPPAAAKPAARPKPPARSAKPKRAGKKPAAKPRPKSEPETDAGASAPGSDEADS